MSLSPLPPEEEREVDGEPSASLDAHPRAHDLLLATQSGPAEIFGGDDPGRLALDKEAADILVKLQLAEFADAGRTRLAITNAGRYWALNGGYMAFLKEPPAAGQGGGRQRNPELEALRFDYMRLRMNTFWWTFGLSIASFVISLVTLSVAYFYGGALFR